MDMGLYAVGSASVWRLDYLGFYLGATARTSDADYSGANASAHGGGKTTCCGSISGKSAEIIWTLSTTRDQYNAGLRKEIRHVVMQLPERKWGENDLHVHFLPGDKVLLGWSDNAWSPYEKNPNPLSKSVNKEHK